MSNIAHAQKPLSKCGLGVSRVLNIDTTGGPMFGSSQFKDHIILSKGEVIITFDDGPSQYTPEVLDVLDDFCTRATFFLIGNKVKGQDKHTYIVRSILKRGHTIASHTFSHANLGRMKKVTQIEDEIDKGMEALDTAIGEKDKVARFFRFPGLNYNAEGLDLLERNNISAFSIDIDSNDSKYRDVEPSDINVRNDVCGIMKRVKKNKRFYWPDEIVNSVMEQLAVKKKGIILLHDIHCRTVEALPKLLKKLKDEDYFVVHLKDAN